jgi:hypothetical protein
VSLVKVDPALMSELARLASGLDDAGLKRAIACVNGYLDNPLDMGGGVVLQSEIQNATEKEK